LPTLVAPARSISRCVTGETACALAQTGAGIAIVDQFVLMGEAVFSNLVVRAFEPKTEAKMCLIRSKLRRLSRVSQRFVSVLADRSSGNDRAFCPLRKSRRRVGPIQRRSEGRRRRLGRMVFGSHPASAERRHNRARPFAHELRLVVKMDAHPELARTRVDRRLRASECNHLASRR